METIKPSSICSTALLPGSAENTHFTHPPLKCSALIYSWNTEVMKGEKQKMQWSIPPVMFLQDSQRLMPQLRWALSFPGITHMTLPSDFLRKASCKPSGILKPDGDTVQLIFLRELSSSSGKLSFRYTTTYTQFFQTNNVSFREYTSHDKTIKRSKAMINLKVWRKGLPWWSSGKESTLQCRARRFDPWLGN